MILENAFARDSKPGKEARQAIAKLVTMNEKQVQVRTYHNPPPLKATTCLDAFPRLRVLWGTGTAWTGWPLGPWTHLASL